MPKKVKAEKKQIKSKKRVAEHGEVFTNAREVNAMLDLVKDESERIDSRFLEPACGDGNFLSEILSRKLKVVKSKYGKNHSDYEKYSIVALTSIYGVELLQDNVEECIKRLYDIWNVQYTKNCKKDANNKVRKAAKYILEKNILCGDALTLLKSDKTPIIFAEWSLAQGNMLKRRDFRLDQMMEGHNDQMSLDMFVQGNEWEYDKEIDAMVPAPIKEYGLTDYWEVQKNG
jgi:hypothetical protein